MGERRPHRRLSPQVREPVGRQRERPQGDDELTRLMASGDFSQETQRRIAELLGQFGQPWPGPENAD
jgi:hypothetical protein